MTGPIRIAAFAGALVLASGAAAVAGAAIDPKGADDAAPHPAPHASSPGRRRLTAVSTSRGADQLGNPAALTDGFSAAFVGAPGSPWRAHCWPR